MATYYVHKGTGTDGAGVSGATGAPWATLAYSLTRMSANDTLKVRAGATPYYEQVTIPPSLSGITIEADTGHDPIIDGKYGPDEGYFKANGDFVMPSGRVPPVGNDWVFEGENTAQMAINAADVTIRGLIFRYSPGRCLTFNRDPDNGKDASGSAVYDCIFDFAYDACVVINSNKGLIEDIIVEDCFILRSSMRKFDPDAGAPGQGPDAVATTYKPVRGKNCILRNSVLAWCGGEGAAAAKGSTGTIIEGNVIFDTYHWSMGNQRAKSAIFRNNFTFHTGRKEFLQTDKAGNLQLPDGIVIGDEGGSPSFGDGATPSFYNNILANWKYMVWLRASGNYDTQMTGAYLGFNTFAFYPDVLAEVAIKIDKGQYGDHYNNLFENNIVYAGQGKIFTGTATGFTFRHNAFRAAPPMGGQNNFVESDSQKIYASVPAKIQPSDFTFEIDMDSPTLIAALPTYATLRAMAERYRIPNSSGAKDRASDGGRVAVGAYSITPPTYPRNTDFFGAPRDNSPDMGAHENGAAPTPDVVADFTPSASPAYNQTITFTDSSTYLNGAVLATRAWTITKPDTSTQNGTASTINVTFDQTGTWTVELAMTSSPSGSDTKTLSYSVAAAVTASYTYSPAGTSFNVGSAAASKTFTNTTTPALATTTYLWTLTKPDTSTVTATTKDYSYVFATAGTYTLTLRATPAGGSANTTPALTFTVGAAPTGDNLDASFTQDVSTGQAPLTVTFTNTTSLTGAAVDDTWLWDFGDGATSTAENPSHTYTTAGAYTVTFTASDSTLALSDSATSTVTVTAPPPPAAGGDVDIRQTRVALNTTVSTQAITIADWVTNSITPKAVEIIVTAATADGTAADGELLSVGYAASTSGQVVAVIASDHGVANVNAARRWADDAVILTINGSGTQTGRASIQSWDEGGITLNITDAFPSAYLATFVFRTGTEYQGWVGTAALGNANSTTTVTPGFAADAAHFAATWGTDDIIADDATMSLGMATRDGNQGMVERWYADGLADGANYLRMYTDQVAQCRYNTAKRAGVICETWTPTGFNLRVQNDNINSSILILAERFGSTYVSLSNIASDTSPASATDYSLSWDPQFVKLLISQATATGSYNDAAAAGTFGIHTVTSDGEFSNSVSGENGAATTNEQSLSDNQLILVGHTGTSVAVGATVLGTSKYTVTYSTAPATAYSWPALVVQEGQAPAPDPSSLTAEFTADVTSGKTPMTVQFTDLSSAENTTITGWTWTFGDGAGSTEQNPSYTYLTAGAFTVSLTVDDGGVTTSDTETKTEYIAVSEKKKRIIIIGPFLAKPVTETSETITRYDDAAGDDTQRGTIEMGLSLNYLPLADDATEPDTVTDQVSIYAQASAPKVKQADGTVKTFTVS